MRRPATSSPFYVTCFSMFVGALVLLAPANSMAQPWFDGFETYADGTLLDNVGGWAGWDNNPAFAGTATSAEARSGGQSIVIGANIDAVRPYLGAYTSGVWQVTAWMLLKQADHTSDTYFIIQNEYNHGGPYQWTTQMQFDPTNGMVDDDYATSGIRNGAPLPIVYDQWVEIVVIFDLDNDLQETYYDGTLLSDGPVTTGTGAPLEIASLDLFSAGSAVSYFDDLSIDPVPVKTTADSFNIIFGTLQAGGLPELADSDDQRLDIQAIFPISVTFPGIRYDTQFTLPNDNPTTLQVVLEGYANDVGVDQRILLRNVNTNQFEEIDIRDAGFNAGNEFSITVDATGNLTRFVEAGTGLVTVRIETFTDGTGFQAIYRYLTDELSLRSTH